MKKITTKIILLLSIIGLGACTQSVVDNTSPTEELINYSINVGSEIAAVTRAVPSNTNSEKGGLTNVDPDLYDVRYIVEVYNQAGDKRIARQVKAGAIVPSTELKRQKETFNFRLTPNRTYKFVVWADFVTKGTESDLHYNTADLKNITCIDAVDKQLNDESRDAYTIVQDEYLPYEGKTIELVCKRPFAKMRVITTDWNTSGGAKNQMPDNFRITYYGGKRFNNYNAITKESNSETLGDLASSLNVYTREIAISKDEKYYKLGYEYESPANRTLTVDYLMTDKDDQTPIHLLFEALDGTSVITTYNFTIDVPIQRNYLTTLMGNMLTIGSKIILSIQEDFENTGKETDPPYWVVVLTSE